MAWPESRATTRPSIDVPCAAASLARLIITARVQSVLMVWMRPPQRHVPGLDDDRDCRAGGPEPPPSLKLPPSLEPAPEALRRDEPADRPPVPVHRLVHRSRGRRWKPWRRWKPQLALRVHQPRSGN